MENGNRIGSLSITPTVARQTPQNDFGTVFARAAQEVVRAGAGVAANLVPGGPAVSAAVSSISSVVSSATAGGARAASTTPLAGGAGGAGGPLGTGASGQGEQWDLLAAQKEMQAEGMKMNLAYMNLQNDMQKESRAHNALSNIMKVRHDSAKAAINNIR